MTDKTYSRRECLQTVGVGFAGIPLREKSIDTDDPITPERLLVSTPAVPPDFSKTSVSGSAPLIQILQEQDSAFSRVDTAKNGFTVGEDPENLEWVLSSLAVVCDTVIPQSAVAAAALKCMKTCAASYEAEIRSDVDLTMTTTRRAHGIDTRIDLSCDSCGIPDSIAVTEFTDLLRIQYHGSVLLGTVTFGPRNGTHSIEELLARAARQQREQLREATATQ